MTSLLIRILISLAGRAIVEIVKWLAGKAENTVTFEMAERVDFAIKDVIEHSKGK